MRLNHVTPSVLDVARSADFYVGLGLGQIVADYPDYYARLEAAESDTTLSLHRVEHASPQPCASIQFEVDDVDRAVRALKRAGVDFVSDPVDQPYLRREAIRPDPDGKQVFVYHAGEDRLNPPWRLER